jgi:ribonuclease HIII
MSTPLFYKTKLATASARTQLHKALLAQGTVWQWTPNTEQYCAYRLDGRQTDGRWLRVKQYNNGTLTLEANTPEALLWARALAEGQPAPSLTATVPATLDHGSLNTLGNPMRPALGTDESGKGDYFGALVVAGVALTPQGIEALASMGVADCKTLSDAAVRKMAVAMVQALGASQVAYVVLPPLKYNTVYARLKADKQNLNHLLGQAHAKVITTLLGKAQGLDTLPAPTPVIVDKFAATTYVTQYLTPETQQAIALTMVPKAEEALAVAAASVIARYQFLQSIDALSAEVGVTLPLGAGAPVVAAAKALVARQGAGVLQQVAKLHFKTTQTVGG